MPNTPPERESPATRGVPQIVAALEDEIVSGRWPTGTRIPSERILSERFGVARTMIREALRVLRERQLVEASVGRGTFVREMNPAMGAASAELLARSGLVTASDLIVARETLEPAAAALAAENHTASDLSGLQSILDRFGHTYLPDAADIDLAFHTAIVAASHNPVMQVMFGSIRTLAHAMMARSLSDPRVAGADLHAVIFERIAQRDALGARDAMLRHIRAARTFYGSDLDEPLADVLRRRAELSPGLAAVLRGMADSADDERT